MNRLNTSVLLVGLFLLATVGMQGQTQTAGKVDPVDAIPTIASRVDPDSPSTSSTGAASHMANVPRLMKFRAVSI
jgi:hypothetical protein